MSGSATHGKRRIAVVTGTRAEYGLLQSTMQAIAARRGMQLQLIVTGIHLLRGFGHTIKVIRGDGWRIDAEVRMQRGSDTPTDQADGLSRGIAGIAKYLERASTDVVVVLGDRIEALAGALAAVTTGRLVAHIHGGDRASGDLDEGIRHAITKLAHVHFPATQAAARRIVRMGEEQRHVHCVGAPGLDRLRRILGRRRAPAPRSNQALVVFHPIGRSARIEQRAMETLLDGVAEQGLARRVILPNTDRGHAGVVAAVERHRRSSDLGDVDVVRSADRDTFLSWLIESDVIVGNSSAGIIEAPAAGTPTVDVGSRQRGRLVGGRSVVHAEECSDDIRRALRSALRKRPIIWGETVYGDGKTGPRIAACLARMPMTEAVRRKLNSY